MKVSYSSGGVAPYLKQVSVYLVSLISPDPQACIDSKNLHVVFIRWCY